MKNSAGDRGAFSGDFEWVTVQTLQQAVSNTQNRPATEQAQWPMVDRHVRWMLNYDNKAECMRCQAWKCCSSAS